MAKEKHTNKNPAEAAPSTTEPGRFLQMMATLRQNLFLATMAGVLAFAGALAGTVLTLKVQRAIWEEEVHYNEQGAIVERRLDLLDRTVKLMSRSKVVTDALRESAGEALSTAAKLTVDPTAIVREISKRFQEQTLAKCKTMESKTEYRTTLSLNAIYFGPETRKAVEAIYHTDPWWEIDSTQRVGLVQAMEKELLLEVADE